MKELKQQNSEILYSVHNHMMIIQYIQYTNITTCTFTKLQFKHIECIILY